MANVHRVYEIKDDCYYVRVEGSPDVYGFKGPNRERDSYAKLRTLILQEQRKDPRSKMIDHAQAT